MANASRPRPTVLTVTKVAAARIREIMATKPGAVALKIGLKKGGCAGMEYDMQWSEEIGKFDEVIEVDGAKVVVDPSAVLYLLGSEMDFKADKFSAQFVFNNPNQMSACGCGVSVELKPAAGADLTRADN
jgi:iron-sulfur cluster assembly protein